MGQSIQHTTLKSIEKEALRNMSRNADKHTLQRFYRLGEGYCEFNQRDSEILYSIVHDNLCEVNYIINRALESVSCIYKPEIREEKCQDDMHYGKDRIKCKEASEGDSALYQLWLNRGNTGTMEDFLDALFKDEKMNWYKMDW